MHSLTYNVYAAVAAILNPELSVDDAISRFSPPTLKERYNRSDRVPEIARMRKQGKTWNAIGSVYGVTGHAVRVMLGRAEGRL